MTIGGEKNLWMEMRCIKPSLRDSLKDLINSSFSPDVQLCFLPQMIPLTKFKCHGYTHYTNFHVITVS